MARRGRLLQPLHRHIVIELYAHPQGVAPTQLILRLHFAAFRLGGEGFDIYFIFFIFFHGGDSLKLL